MQIHASMLWYKKKNLKSNQMVSEQVNNLWHSQTKKTWPLTFRSWSCWFSQSRNSWCRWTATRCGSARQRSHTPSCVSSSQTGQCSVVKYCEMVPFLVPSSPPPLPAELHAFCTCAMKSTTTKQMQIIIIIIILEMSFLLLKGETCNILMLKYFLQFLYAELTMIESSVNNVVLHCYQHNSSSIPTTSLTQQ